MHFNLDITTVTKSAYGRAECENPGQSPKEISRKPLKVPYHLCVFKTCLVTDLHGGQALHEDKCPYKT